MAHYDCDNCGYSMGNAYGYCSNCTPDWVIEAKKKYKKVVTNAYSQAKIEFESRIDKRAQKLIGDAKDEYNLIYEAGKEWYKNRPDES